VRVNSRVGKSELRSECVLQIEFDACLPRETRNQTIRGGLLVGIEFGVLVIWENLESER